MSATKKFLADPANYSGETKRGLTDPAWSALRTFGIIIRNRLVCNDGFDMSVQYSTGHYCNGRERFLGGKMESRTDPYPEPTHVEVGFPSRAERLLKPYAEEAGFPKGVTERYLFIDSAAPTWHEASFRDRLYAALRYGDRFERWIAEKVWPQRSNLTDTVYAWVPVEVVDRVIAKHGGIAGGEHELATSNAPDFGAGFAGEGAGAAGPYNIRFPRL